MTIRLKNILCAIDFSDFTAEVLRHGVGLAGVFDARLIILHVLYTSQQQFYAKQLSSSETKLYNRLPETEQRITELMQSSPVAWEPLVVLGDPVSTIMHHAADRNAGLVILGSHGLSGLQRLVLGTVVERLARVLDRPLLVTRAPTSQSGNTFAPKRIAVAWGLTEHTNGALRWAVGLAKYFKAELKLVHALERPVDVELVNPTEAPYGEVQKRLTNKIHRRLAEAAQHQGVDSNRFSTHVIPGVPAEILPRFFASQGVDLLVLVSREKRGSSRKSIGATTEKALRSLKIPVLAVPPGPKTASE